MRVNVNISELFFNSDHSESLGCEDEYGDFAGWSDPDAQSFLRTDAESFLARLGRLGVDCPTVDDLIADFMDRL